MTPDDEAQFITRWQAGVPTAEIAQQLGLAPGTVKSRAHTLQQQGKIQPRPRGGRRPRTREGAAVEPPPAVHAPRTRTRADPAAAKPPPGLVTVPPELLDLLLLLRNLLFHPGAEGVALRTRPRLRTPAGEETRQPWTLRLRPSVRAAVMAAAARLGQPHNHLVEAALEAYLRQLPPGDRPAPPAP